MNGPFANLGESKNNNDCL